MFRGNLWEQSTTGGNSSIGNFVPFFSLILFLFFLFVFNLFCLIGIHCCMSIWVRNKRGGLEIFETYFGNLFDTPLPSPSSSIMGDETRNNHEENRRTMYELLHLT